MQSNSVSLNKLVHFYVGSSRSPKMSKRYSLSSHVFTRMEVMTSGVPKTLTVFQKMKSGCSCVSRRNVDTIRDSKWWTNNVATIISRHNSSGFFLVGLCEREVKSYVSIVRDLHDLHRRSVDAITPHILIHTWDELEQWWRNGGPRAGSGPSICFIRPANKNVCGLVLF